MNATRTLGLLAAILVTAAQATVLAVDTRAATQEESAPVHLDAANKDPGNAEAELAYSFSRGLIGG
jgi:hypothetical protein